MKTVLLPCIQVLLDYPGATLRELQRFADDKQNADLVDFARSRTHYQDIQRFFERGYVNEQHLRVTKDAVKTKLQYLLNRRMFANLTCGNGGKSTINLDRAWNERKIVVFNLPAGNMAELSNAFGRLIVALLQGIAKRRVDIPERERVPCHLIVDEMEYFLTRSMEELLRFSRKYKLIFTGCQQVAGSGMTPDMQKAIIGNTYIKIAGSTEAEYARAAADLFPVDKDTITRLGLGEFCIRIGRGSPTFKFSIRKDYLGAKKQMSAREWERVKADQLKRYYRRITAQAPAPAPAKGVAEVATAETKRSSSVACGRSRGGSAGSKPLRAPTLRPY
jgi:hypothetical protein